MKTVALVLALCAIAGVARASPVSYVPGNGPPNVVPPGRVDPMGACCFRDNSCVILTLDECEAAGGWYQGDGVSCDPNPCPLVGACCFGNDCMIYTWEDCAAAGGYYQGDGTTCDPNPCIVPPSGACCFPDGRCELRAWYDCDGEYQGDYTSCEPNPCHPTRAKSTTWGQIKGSYR